MYPQNLSNNPNISPSLRQMLQLAQNSSNYNALSQNSTLQSAKSQDTFEKQNSRRRIREKIINALISASSMALVFCIPILLSRHMSKKALQGVDLGKADEFKENIGDIGNNIRRFIDDDECNLSSIWQDITDAMPIGEMCLPQRLKKLFNSIIQNINNPEGILERGGQTSRTILLYGPPGTGKTTFAKGLAKYFPDAKFASFDFTNLNSKYSGQTEKNIRKAVDEICDQASKNKDKKFFVFIDEIDSIILVDESLNRTISNKALNEFKKSFTEKLAKQDNIYVIGATNVSINPEKNMSADGKMLDRAMLDRFRTKVLVDLPDENQILDKIISNYKTAPKVSDELKAESKQLRELAIELRNKKVSFRDLQTIFNESASQSTGDNSILDFETFKNVCSQTIGTTEKNKTPIGFGG